MDRGAAGLEKEQQKEHDNVKDEHTLIGVIVHESDPVENVGEGGYVLHWLTVCADKGGILYGSGYHGAGRKLLMEIFEELEHICGICGAFGISLLA